MSGIGARLIMPSPRKYKSPLHKRMERLEKEYEAAEGKPLKQVRIMRRFEALAKKVSK